MDPTVEFYSRPSHSYRGGSFPVFTGSRRQRGGSVFGALKKFFMPVTKMIGPALLSHGASLARDIAQDVMSGKNIKSALMNRGKAAAINLGKEAISKGMLGKVASMIGKGRRRAKRRRKVNRKRKVKRTSRKATSRKATSRKRRARSQSIHRRSSSSKRRRVANF